MITKQEFFKAITEHQQFNDAVERMSKNIGGNNCPLYLFETDWCMAEENLFNIFLESHFTEEAVDTIYWWLYDDVDKVIYISIEKDLFTEETEDIIPVRTLGQLWSFLEREPKLYFKNV